MRERIVKDFNSFDRIVEMIPEADAILFERYDKTMGVVVGYPYSTETGTGWPGLTMMSSKEEAKNCKYPKAFDEKDEELVALFSQPPSPHI